MGYSARYHATSLVAVFLALAIGILIGVGLGSDVVSDTSKDLEESLTGDLEAARADLDSARAELEAEGEISSRALTALVAGTLTGERIGLLALGGLPGSTAEDVEQALEPTGAALAAVAVVRFPPDRAALAEATGRRSARRSIEGFEAMAEQLGRRIVRGRELGSAIAGPLLARSSGRLGRLDGVVVVNGRAGEEDEEREALGDALRDGILAGIVSSRAEAVGVERTDTDPGSLAPLSGAGISTVDHVDAETGRASMVFVLLGAEGNFGTNEGADGPLPDLLTIVPDTRP